MKLLLAAIAAAMIMAPVAQAVPDPASPSVLCQGRAGYPHIEEFCDQEPGYWDNGNGIVVPE